LPVSIRAIGSAAPPLWRLSRVEPDNPQAAEPSSGLAEVMKVDSIIEGAPEEDCSNGLDADGDREADCQDAKCAKETFCHGGGRCNGVGKVDQLQVSKPRQCVSGGALQILYFTPVGQEFTPGSPNIVAIELLLESFNPPYTDNLSVRIREGSITGAI